MRSIIPLIAAAIALTFPLQGFCQPDDWPIMSFSGPDGKQFGFYVSDATFKSTPEWVFDGKTPPPLSFLDAHSKAYESVRKRFPKIEDFQLRSYTLQRVGSSRSPNRWYYIFDFAPKVAGIDLGGFGFNAMLLLDGTVIEPREEKGE